MIRPAFPPPLASLAVLVALLTLAEAASAQPPFRGRGPGGPPSRGDGGSAEQGDRGGYSRRGDRGSRYGGGDQRSSSDRGERGDRGGESDRRRGGDDRGSSSRGGDDRGGDDRQSREQRIFDWVWSRADKNGDGKLTGDEVGDDRMKRFMEQRGLDPDKTYTRDEWNRGAAAYAEKRAAEERNESDGDRDARRSGGDDSRRSASSSGPTFVRGGVKDARGRVVRVTRTLPEAFGEFDADGDGQVGLYEWRRWNRTLLAEFMALDRDGDGYLTPRELDDADAGEYARGDSALPSSERSDQPTDRSMPAASVAFGSRNTSTADDEPAEIDPRDRATAERYFKLLDADRSGRLSLTEWQKSEKLKPKFEAVGADLESELNLDEFVAAYAKTLQ